TARHQPSAPWEVAARRRSATDYAASPKALRARFGKARTSNRVRSRPDLALDAVGLIERAARRNRLGGFLLGEDRQPFDGGRVRGLVIGRAARRDDFGGFLLGENRRT